MELGKLFAAVGQSVQQAQEALAQQEVERYLRYFLPANGEGLPVCPKTLRISVDGTPDRYVDVPLAVMTPHTSIGLKQVKITMRGEVFADEQSESAMIRAGVSQGAEVRGDTIELLFESTPQSEGQARATQKMLDHIEL